MNERRFVSLEGTARQWIEEADYGRYDAPDSKSRIDNGLRRRAHVRLSRGPLAKLSDAHGAQRLR